jgi:hypothetical protein
LKTPAAILQIVPRVPGTLDGVGDYALIVANKLRQTYGRESIFAAGELDSATSADGFDAVSLNSLGREEAGREFDHVILHCVNYGYQKRGVPFALLGVLRKLRGKGIGCLLTIFHELYASAPPWRSAFWLRPLQVHISRSIAELSDACIVSSEATLAELKRLAPGAKVSVHPVVSNFGEPSLASDHFAHRDLHRWVICGGTALVERSIRSFRTIVNRIPEAFSPRELVVLGGTDNPATRATIAQLRNLGCAYHPQIEAEEASRILSTCSFAWVDYFHRLDVPISAILKSTAFAAACAHGIIPVFPHSGSTISLHGDELPGPFFVNTARSELPKNPAKIAAEIYAWYERGVSSDHLVRGIAHALDLVSDATTRR